VRDDLGEEPIDQLGFIVAQQGHPGRIDVKEPAILADDGKQIGLNVKELSGSGMTLKVRQPSGQGGRCGWSRHARSSEALGPRAEERRATPRNRPG